MKGWTCTGTSLVFAMVVLVVSWAAALVLNPVGGDGGVGNGG